MTYGSTKGLAVRVIEAGSEVSCETTTNNWLSETVAEVLDIKYGTAIASVGDGSKPIASFSVLIVYRKK